MSHSSASPVVVPPDASSSSDSALITCQSCGSRLPIRTAVWKELPALWRCIQCGSHHCGVLSRDTSCPMKTNVVLAAKYFDCLPAMLVHEWADSLVEHLHHQELHTAITDKRTSPRIARNLHAQVIAVDEHWAPRGKSFPVIVYNISTGGLAYISATITRAPLLAIQLAAGGAPQIVAQNIWARPQFGGLFSVGVKFLCRLGAGAA